MIVRQLAPDEDMVALTELIHRAYAPLAERGLKYWATHQTVQDTIERCAMGETWLAELDERVVGTITMKRPGDTRGSDFYRRTDICVFNQLAVEPALQGQGIARVLIERVESRAVALGAAFVACDTSEHATELIAMYERRGYRYVEHADWRPKVNYRSVILALPLGTGGQPPPGITPAA